MLDPASLRPAGSARPTAWRRRSRSWSTDVPAAARRRLTSRRAPAALVAYAPNGYVRWQRNLGVAPNSCPQLDEYGVTGTPVVDPATRAIYVADALRPAARARSRHGRGASRLAGAHLRRPRRRARLGCAGRRRRLDLRRHRLVLRPADGGQADPRPGRDAARLDVRRSCRRSSAAAAASGAGAAPAYSAQQDALFVVTGNAFEGGTNTGAAFDEAAGYGEHLVELTPRPAACSPRATRRRSTGADDFDFVGSPVIFTPPGCDEVVAAVNKNGRLFLWHAASIAAGPFVDLALQKPSQEQPLLTQPAYDAATRSLYVATFTALVRVSLTGCDSRDGRLEGRRSRTRRCRARRPSPARRSGSRCPARRRTCAGTTRRPGGSSSTAQLGGMSFAPPSVIGGRLFEGARHGFAGQPAGAFAPRARLPRLRAYTSWSDKRHGVAEPRGRRLRDR